MLLRSLVALTLSLFTLSTYAALADSPAGNWQTMNEQSKQPGSIVTLTQEGPDFVGTIRALLPGSKFKEHDLCSKCPAPYTNKPIVGLKFMWGFVSDGKGGWKDGKLMDPNTGKIYSGTMKVIDGGAKLELKGYWGPFWKTQTWDRAN